MTSRLPWLCFFLALSYMSCLYSLKIHPLSVASSANINALLQGVIIVVVFMSLKHKHLVAEHKGGNTLSSSPWQNTHVVPSSRIQWLLI